MLKKYNKIIFKISGEIFGDYKTTLNKKNLFSICQFIKILTKSKPQIGVVIGGGNIFRGKNKNYQKEIKQENDTIKKKENNRNIKSNDFFKICRTTGNSIGLISTIINSLILFDVLKSINVKSEILSSLSIKPLIKTFSVRDMEKSFEKKKIVIFAGGTGSNCFSTDTAAAVRAIESKSEVIIKMTKVDGVYDRDPKIYKDSKKFNWISYSNMLKKRIKIMDLTSILLCMENKIPIFILKWNNLKSIKSAINKKLSKHMTLVSFKNYYCWLKNN
jgi:uridylate kinase